MPDVTRILHQLEAGDASAADELLPLVYAELRKLADQRLAQEKPGQTLQATALVHEAYVRLVDVDQSQDWDGRGHFFAAAAEAMRRILVENARSKQCIKRGGECSVWMSIRFRWWRKKSKRICWRWMRPCSGWLRSMPRQRSWSTCVISEGSPTLKLPA